MTGTRRGIAGLESLCQQVTSIGVNGLQRCIRWQAQLCPILLKEPQCCLKLCLLMCMHDRIADVYVQKHS